MFELFRRVWDVVRRSVRVALAGGAIAIAAALIRLVVARAAAASGTHDVTLADPSALSAGRAGLVQALAELQSSPPQLPPH
jgi:hypothetical protein